MFIQVDKNGFGTYSCCVQKQADTDIEIADDVFDMEMIRPYMKYNAETEQFEKDEDKYAEYQLILLEDAKNNKISEIGAVCSNTIYAGVDVELSEGTKHFSLTNNDQLDINSLGLKIITGDGQAPIPYHADKTDYAFYSLEDAKLIFETATKYIDYHRTYCNLLNQTIRAMETEDEINSVTYGMELPEDKDELLIEITGISSKELSL